MKNADKLKFLFAIDVENPHSRASLVADRVAVLAASVGLASALFNGLWAMHDSNVSWMTGSLSVQIGSVAMAIYAMKEAK